jgi:hypothetical protein
MPETDDTLLDLSAWPAQPSAAAPARVPVPRPPRTPRRLPLTLKAAGGALVALGAALLLVPVPGCGASLAAVLRDPQALPADTAPDLDDAQLSADDVAVRDAEAALAAWRSPAPRHSPASSARGVTVSAVSDREVRSAEAEVTAAQRQESADRAELDRLLTEQEESDDPGAYDGQVAAAREQLEASSARLVEARHAVAVARARTTRVTVTPSAAPTRARPAPATSRAVLVAALADARTTQAAHLAARKKQLASARADQQARTAEVVAHNARVRSCSRRSGVPVSGGSVLLVLGAAALVRHRLTV